jgi:hypothetical protein
MTEDTSEIDFYEVLGVEPRATDAELKAAYRRLARIHHPDANQSEADATRFKQITHAYAVLSNPERRAEYDQMGTLFLANTANWSNAATWDDPLDDVPIVTLEEMLPDAAAAPTEEVGSLAPRNWDFLLSTFLVIMLIAQTALFVVLGFAFGIQVISCQDEPGVCNIDVINWSARIVIFGTPIIAIAAIVVTVVRLVQRKHAWWIPLAGMVINFGIYLVATRLVDLAVP